MLLSTLFSSLLTATAVTAAYPACKGARQTSTGKGYAAIKWAASGMAPAERVGHAGEYPTFFACSDECWRAGPRCRAVNWFSQDKACIMLQDDGIVEVVVGKGSPEVDTAIKGNCDDHAELFKDKPELKCCNLWM